MINRTYRFPYIFFLLTLLVVSSRSLLELMLPRQVAYTIQFVFLVVFALYFTRILYIRKIYYILFYTAFLLIICSLLYTTVYSSISFKSSFSVVVVNLLNIYYLTLALIFLENIDRFKIDLNKSVNILRFLSLSIIITSIMQVYGLIDFTGSFAFQDNKRLTGAFGSMQHYSIFLSVISFLVLAVLYKRFSFLDLIIFIFLLYFLAISLTRIGYIIFIVSLLGYFILTFLSEDYNKIAKFIPYLIFFAFGMLLFYYIYPDFFESFLGRILSINLEDYSNQLRVQHWISGFNFYFEGPILIGVNTGFASQIPSLIFSENSFHFESAVIQYLINFGFIFFVLFLFIFYKWFSILKYGCFTKGLPLGMFVALFIYMYNEVAPIFILFLLISLISSSIEKSSSR